MKRSDMAKESEMTKNALAVSIGAYALIQWKKSNILIQNGLSSTDGKDEKDKNNGCCTISWWIIRLTHVFMTHSYDSPDAPSTICPYEGAWDEFLLLQNTIEPHNYLIYDNCNRDRAVNKEKRLECLFGPDPTEF